MSSYHQNQDENPHSHSPRIPLSSRRTPPPHLLLPFPSRPSDAPVPFPSRPSAALVLTTETVLESVDSCPALPKTTDDGPSPPAHSVPLVIPPAAVDDVEVCVCSGTMKNTLWVTPKRFRRLRSRILRCQRVKGQKKKNRKKKPKIRFSISVVPTEPYRLPRTTFEKTEVVPSPNPKKDTFCGKTPLAFSYLVI